MSRRLSGGAKMPPQPHPVLLHPLEEYLPVEDRLAHNCRELQVLVSDHHELTSTHSSLKHDLSLAHQQLRQLSAAASQIREDKETRVKELYERSLAIDSQFRGVEALGLQHSQVVEDIKKLTESKLELAAQFKAIDSELQKVKAETSEVVSLRADSDNLRLDILKGRAALETEKKMRAANLELYEAMERNIMSLQSEIERLRLRSALELPLLHLILILRTWPTMQVQPGVMEEVLIQPIIPCISFARMHVHKVGLQMGYFTMKRF